MEEEADWAKEEADKVRLMKATPTFNKKAGTTIERLEGGGASMPDQDDKRTLWNAATMATLAIMRRDERRKVSRLPQAGNSQTISPTPTMNIMVEGS